MKYLLDVNALMAMCHTSHSEHARFHAWHASQTNAVLASCAIGDLGFIRISMTPAYNYTLEGAEKALASMRRDLTGYIDTMPPPRLARWVLSHKQTTDAYLCQLASANGMKLATFDTRIKDPAAFLIP